MVGFYISLQAVAPMFVLMAIGACLKKRRMLGEAALKQMNGMVFYVLIPMLLFRNIYTTDLADSFQPKLLTFCVLGVLALWGILLLAAPRFIKDKRRCGALIQGLVRSNSVIFGIPILENLFGSASLPGVGMAMAVTIPLYNIIGVVTLEIFRGGRVQGGKIAVGVLKNPSITMSAAALALLGLGIRLPGVFEKAMTDLAGATTPLALILMGASLSFITVRASSRMLFTAAAAKLLLIPFCGLSLARAAGFTGLNLAILLIVFAAPTAVATFSMAQEMDSDAEFAAGLVAVSTVLSLGTVFLWILFLSWAGWI